MKVIFTKGGITGKWSWTLYSTNGQRIAQSRTALQGYSRRIDCVNSFIKLRQATYIQGVVQDSHSRPITCYGL